MKMNLIDLTTTTHFFLSFQTHAQISPLIYPNKLSQVGVMGGLTGNARSRLTE